MIQSLPGLREPQTGRRGGERLGMQAGGLYSLHHEPAESPSPPTSEPAHTQEVARCFFFFSVLKVLS